MTTLVMTCVGGLGMPELVTHVRSLNLVDEIIGLDARSVLYHGLFDRVIKCPNAELRPLEWRKRLPVADAYWIGSDHETLILHPEFEPLADTAHLLSTMAAHDLPTPWFHRDRYFITKHPRGQGSRSVTFHESPGLVMESLPGIDVSVDVLYTDGELTACVMRERHRTRGMSLEGAVIDEPKVRDQCASLGPVFRCHGLMNVQLRQSRMGKWLVYEVNPRPSASVMASVLVSGVDLVEGYLCQQLGTDWAPPSTVRTGRFVRHLSCEIER